MRQTYHNLAKIWVASLLALAVTSCKSYKDSIHWEDVERYNGSSIIQRGKGSISTGESALITGSVKYFGSNQPLEEARITFVTNNGDTLINTITDKNGKFTGTISPFGFSGSVVVYKVYERFSTKDVEILPTYKNYDIEIKIPKKYMVDTKSEFSPKDERKLRKALRKKLKKQKLEQEHQ